MSDDDIIYYYDMNPNVTLYQLSLCSGRSIRELKAILCKD